MNNTKEKKATLQITLSSLLLTVILIAELYLMIADPIEYSIIPIAILGVVALVIVYVLVNAIMIITNEREALRQEHFDNLYRSEKASYLMLKNKFEEIEEKLAIIQETSKIPSEEIINAQKGIAKVIINRSKENADAIINSNDQVLERLDEIDETQNTKFTGISKDQRLKLTEMSNQTELKLQDMVVQLKDMELRLNQAIIQNAGAKSVVVNPEVQVDTKALIEEESLFAPEPLMAEDDISIEKEMFPMMEELPIEEFESEMLDSEETIQVEDMLEDILEDIIDDSAVVEETTIVAPEIDLSDPNKALSPDDIAALFASMAGGNTTEEAAEPEVEEPEVEEPEVEELPPMPDLSDPNRTMTPDEIAALIANL